MRYIKQIKNHLVKAKKLAKKKKQIKKYYKAKKKNSKILIINKAIQLYIKMYSRLTDCTANRKVIECLKFC